jgi:PEP-CTERM motif
LLAARVIVLGPRATDGQVNCSALTRNGPFRRGAGCDCDRRGRRFANVGNAEAIVRNRFRVAAMVVAAGTLFSAPLRADPIALTGGVLDLVVTTGGTGGGLVRVTGDRGFTFIAGMNGFFAPPVGNPMVPGTSIALEGRANGLDLTGSATLDGVTYTGVGGLDSAAQASLRFTTSPATLPSLLNPPSEITAPFRLDLIFTPDGLVNHSLRGTGMATIFLDEDRGFDVPSWRVTGIRAELSSAAAPVPEPATLLLVAAGLGWTIRRRRASRVDGVD